VTRPPSAPTRCATSSRRAAICQGEAGTLRRRSGDRLRPRAQQGVATLADLARLLEGAGRNVETEELRRRL
jgi:hypothetical protein